VTVASLWALTGGNNNADNSDPVTLGTKIRTHATTQLWAIGMRYYRGTISAGTKTGRIFRTSDQSIVSEVVTFTDVGTGWQEVYFTTPVALDLNTSYTPGALFPSGEPSFTGGYFVSGGPGYPGGVTSTPPFLFAPNSDVAFGQGVYVAGASLTCPTSSFNGACYWVDMIVTDVDPGAKQGTGSTSVSLAVTSTGTPRRNGTGSLATTLGITSSGTPRRGGTGTAPDLALSVSSTGAPKRAGTASIGTALAVFGTGVPHRDGTATTDVGLTVTGTGAPRRSGTATIHIAAAVTGAGRIPGKNVGIVRCGPPRTTWSVGLPMTSGGGVQAVMQYGSVQELQVPDVVHDGALVGAGPQAWLAFGPAGSPLPDEPVWQAATWASPGVLELLVDTMGIGLTRGKWNVYVKIADDPAIPYLRSGVLSIY
jgi:hypothetical protein